MIQSFLVYFSTLLLMLLALKGCRKEKENKFFLNFGVGSFVAIMLYTVVMGVRYGVGMDYFGYFDVYNETVARGDSIYLDGWEPAFRYLILFLAKYKLHFSLFFASVAFLQIFIVFKAFKKNKEILPYVVLAFFALSLLSWQNILRQMIAMPIFIYSIQFIKNKDWRRYYFCILIAFLFHKSAIILALIYPIFAFDWSAKKSNLLLQNGFVLASVAAGSYVNQLTNFLFSKLDSLMMFVGYYDDYSEYEGVADATRGVGFYIKLIVVLVIVNLSNKVKDYYKDTPYSIFYTLFVFGYVFGNLITGSITLQRPNYYFIGLDFIVVAYTLSYLNKTKQSDIYKLLCIVLIGALLILTFALIANGDDSTARYFFFWEDAINTYKFPNMR